jgi:cell division transport system permease protein
MRVTSLRPKSDELGLRRLIDSWTVLAAIAGVAFLAMLAGSGWIGSNALTCHLVCGNETTVTILIPSGSNSQGAVGNTKPELLLIGLQGVEWVRILTDEQVEDLLRRWLGNEILEFFAPLPTIISVHITGGPGNVTVLTEWLAQQAPGSILRNSSALTKRLGTLARSVELCARVTLMVVMILTTTAIVVTIRSALVTRRDLIEIAYQLGASDSYIARRFANRGLGPYFVAGMIGALLALPVVFTFAALMPPLSTKGFSGIMTADAPFLLLPTSIMFLPLALSAMIAIIGYGTTQLTVRIWLFRLS